MAGPDSSCGNQAQNHGTNFWGFLLGLCNVFRQSLGNAALPSWGFLDMQCLNIRSPLVAQTFRLFWLSCNDYFPVEKEKRGTAKKKVSGNCIQRQEI